jgi:hypothetical protein
LDTVWSPCKLSTFRALPRTSQKKHFRSTATSQGCSISFIRDCNARMLLYFRHAARQVPDVEICC